MALTRHDHYQIEAALHQARTGGNCLVSPKLERAIAKDSRFDSCRHRIFGLPKHGAYAGMKTTFITNDECFPAQSQE